MAEEGAPNAEASLWDRMQAAETEKASSDQFALLAYGILVGVGIFHAYLWWVLYAVADTGREDMGLFLFLVNLLPTAPLFLWIDALGERNLRRATQIVLGLFMVPPWAYFWTEILRPRIVDYLMQ